MSDILQDRKASSSRDELAALPAGMHRPFVVAYLTEFVEQLAIEDERLPILQAAIGVLMHDKTNETGNDEAFAAWCKDFDVRHAELAARLDGLLASLGVQPMPQKRLDRTSG